MKKLLLSITGLLVFTGSNAQLLQTENFNSLTVGNVGTDFTGITAGQGSWFTFATNGTAPTTTTNSGNANFQIVATGESGSNGLKMQTSNGNKGGKFMWKDGLDTAWAARTTGNNIIQLEFSFFTGPASTSTTQNGINIYGADGTASRIVAGFAYVPATKTLTGIAYLNNGGTFGTFLVNLGTPPIVLADNTWYALGVAYNTTTGAITWKGPGFNNVGVNPVNYAGPYQPIEVDFASATPTTNLTSTDLTFDNFSVTATPTVNLLSTDDFNAEDKTLTVYPNPSSNFITVAANNSIFNTINVIDMNGRTVKTVDAINQSSVEINITDLSAGIYMLNISSDKGTSVKKVVKN